MLRTSQTSKHLQCVTNKQGHYEKNLSVNTFETVQGSLKFFTHFKVKSLAR